MLDESNPLVLKNMEDWSKLIAEKVFEKETAHVPHAVAILAAVEFIVSRIKQSTVVTPAAILKILEGKLEDNDELHKTNFQS